MHILVYYGVSYNNSTTIIMQSMRCKLNNQDMKTRKISHYILPLREQRSDYAIYSSLCWDSYNSAVPCAPNSVPEMLWAQEWEGVLRGNYPSNFCIHIIPPKMVLGVKGLGDRLDTASHFLQTD